MPARKVGNLFAYRNLSANRNARFPIGTGDAFNRAINGLIRRPQLEGTQTMLEPLIISIGATISVVATLWALRPVRPANPFHI
jgi:hypothetical protein